MVKGGRPRRNGRGGKWEMVSEKTSSFTQGHSVTHSFIVSLATGTIDTTIIPIQSTTCDLI